MRRLKWWVTDQVWRWIEWRGSIPFWAHWFWPDCHWCPEMDELLILDNWIDCYCEKAMGKT